MQRTQLPANHAAFAMVVIDDRLARVVQRHRPVRAREVAEAATAAHVVINFRTLQTPGTGEALRGVAGGDDIRRADHRVLWRNGDHAIALRRSRTFGKRNRA